MLPGIVDQMVDTLMANLPKLLEVSLTAVLTLIQGLMDHYPEMINFAPTLIEQLMQTLIDSAPTLIPVAVKIVVTLINGLVQNLWRIVTFAPRLIFTIVSVLLRNLPQIFQIGVRIIIELIKGIGSMIGNVWSTASRLAQKIWEALVNGIKNFPEIGKNIIKGIWDGMLKAKDWLYNKVKDLAKGILKAAKNALGIKSPSRAFRDEFGKWIPEGTAVGIELNTSSALDAIRNMSDELLTEANKAVDVEIGKTSIGGINGSVSEILNTNSKIVVENNNTLELDGEKIYQNQQIVQRNKNLQYAFGGA